VFGAAKYGVLIISIIISIGILYPLIIFSIELTNSPEGLIDLEITNIKQVQPGDYAYVELVLKYKGSIPLRDFTLSINDTNIYFGDVSTGDHVREAVIPVDLIDEIKQNRYNVSFSINGLYSVKVVVKGVE